MKTTEQAPISIEAQLVKRVALTTSVLMVFVCLLQFGLTLVFGSPTTLALGLFMSFALIPLVITGYFQARRGRVEPAVICTISVWYMIALGMLFVGGRVYAIFSVSVLLPVLIALPFVAQRTLQRVITVSLLMFLFGSIIVYFPPIITPTVPDRYVFYITLIFVPILSAVVMLSIWQSGGRLRSAAARMQKAIDALKESERRLEEKVEERTAELGHKNIELEKTFREVSDLAEVSRIVNSTLELEEVKKTIFNALQSVFVFDQMGVFLIDEEHHCLRLSLQEGVAFAPEFEEMLVAKGLPLDAENSFIARSTVNNETILRRAVTAEGLATAGPNDRFIVEKNPLQAFLLCPLEVQRRVIGTMFFVNTRQTFEITESDIGWIQRYVTQLGTAIQNAQLFQAASVAREEAEAANRTKGAFLANMSHEIRTPMNAITGLTHLSLKTDLTTKQQDYLEKIDTSAHALRAIIDDILDFSKIEAGRMQIESIPFSINELLENLATMTMGRAQNKGLELLFRRDPQLPDIVKGDPTRLGQVLINLVGNAIKFTDSGEVEVNLEQGPRQADTISLLISVRDTGIGISEEQRAQLFKSFVQADSTITRRYGGTGLGLAISQHLVQLMGGQIEVTSVIGEGSTFSFELEMKVLHGQVSNAHGADELNALKVLVVDDNLQACEILQEQLKAFGYQSLVAHNGEDAVALLEKTPDVELLLVDWIMPDVDGLEVSRQARQLENPPKIILVSSRDYQELEDDELVDNFIAKPINPSVLNDTILRTFGKNVARQSAHRNRGRKIDLTAIEGARILVVDDSAINRQIAIELLEEVSLQVDSAENGAEALAKLEEDQFDCVLMDVQMPVMDGYTATNRIREIEKFRDLPVLAMTANAMAEDRSIAIEHGMNGHIPKPIDPQELYRMLLHWLAPEAEASSLASEGDGDSYYDPVMDISLPSSLPGLNIHQGLIRVNQNSSLYIKLLNSLVDEYHHSAAEIGKLLANGEGENAVILAHKLRGVANNLGANDVGNLAENIEELLRGGGTCDETKLQELNSALAVLSDSVVQLATNKVEPQTNDPLDFVQLQTLAQQIEQAIADSDPQAGEQLEEMLSMCAGDEELSHALKLVMNALEIYDFSQAANDLAVARTAIEGRQ